MPFIQLRRTNAASADVFTLIFDEECEEIIMQENSSAMLAKHQAHARVNKEKKKRKRNVFLFSITQVTLSFENPTRSLDST